MISKNLYREYWWQAKHNVHEEVFGAVRYLLDAQKTEQTQNLHHLRMYSNRLAMGMSAKDYSTAADGDRMRHNVIRSVVDSATAHIAANRPRPEFITTKGDYSLRKKAKNLSRFVQGQFSSLQQYELSRDVFKDAAIFGTGIQKIYPTPDGRIAVERVLPSEMIVPSDESLTGKPRTIYQHKEILREVAAKIWPQHKDEIADASLLDNEGSYGGDKQSADLISCIECFHLESAPGAGDSRHAIVLSNATLLDEEWEGDFCYSFFRWEKSPLGFWGAGIAEELTPIQSEINFIAQKIQQHFKMMSGQVWMKKGSGIAKQAITNEPWSVNTYRDTPPTHLTPAPINNMFLEYLKLLKGWAFQQVGLSEMFATAMKPAGLNSGEALRTYNDVSSKRFSHIMLNWEDYHMDVAKKMVSCARRIVAGGGSLKVLAESDKYVEQIDFKKVSLPEDKYVLRAEPVNYLSGTAAGKIASLRELSQISPEVSNFAIELLDIPDLENIRSLLNAPIEIVDKYIEGILEDGIYRAPDELMNMVIARQRGTLSLLRAEVDNTPPERVELLRRWIAEVDYLQSLSEPIPPNAGAGEGQQPTGPIAQPPQPQAPDLADLQPASPISGILPPGDLQ